MESRGELPISTLIWQPRASTSMATVVCKATFDLAPGELKLAKGQEPVFDHDAYWDDDSHRSLSAFNDLVPTKPKADVVLVGHGFAPPGKPVRSLVVRFAVEGIDKSMELVADRSVGPDGTVYQGPRFTRMPLVYERAAGGAGSWNPVGIDVKQRDKFGRAPLPNIVPVGRGDDTLNPPEPIGFGPIAPSWPLRENKLGYHRAAFASGAWQNEPLPEGFDLGFFNVAPSDQQIESISESAAMLLENMSPQHPVLASKLPGIRPRITVERRGRQERPPMRADTLVIDTDRSLVTLTWRGHFSIEHAKESYRLRVEVENPRQSWRTVEHAIPSTGRETLLDGLHAEETSTGEDLAKAAASGKAGLPFASSQNKPRDVVTAAKPPGLPFFGASSSENTSMIPLAPPASSGSPRSAPSGTRESNAQLPPTPPGMPPLPPPLPAGMRPQTAEMQGGLPFGDGAPRNEAWSGGYPPVASMAARAPTFGSPAGGATPPGASASAAPATVPPPPIGGPPPLPAPAAPPPLPGPPPLPAPAPPPLPAPAPPPPPMPQASAGPAQTYSKVAPPAPVMSHASAAALGGIVSASNAAADGRPTGPAARAPRRIEGDVLHLLWFNPEVAPRVRRKPEWKKILDQTEQGPFDPDVDEPALVDEPAEMEDRREVYEVIARGTPTGQDGIDNALLDAVRSDGRFAAQLLLLVGEVRFDFDELETLKASVSAATPFAANDEELKKTLDQATAFLSTPGLVASPDVATSMTTRVREAFANSNRPVGPTYLDDQTERALLDRRAYQKRSVFGEPHLRSSFFFAGSSTGIPAYFPEAVGKKLPLFRRLRVRMLVEAHFQADQYESHSAALKVVAVARIVR